MRRLLWLLPFLLTMSVTARAETPPGIPAEILAMVPPEQRMIRMVTNGDYRWKIYFVLDRRLLEKVGSTFVADIAFKLRTSSRSYFEARCSPHTRPICVFTRVHDFALQPLSIAATLFVIRGDGCIFSAGRNEHGESPGNFFCVKDDFSMPVEQQVTGVWP